MKILIHGRKNGYTILYPKPTPIEFYSYASDIQSINANNYEIYYGQYFYVLAFTNSGCIFTKYVIGDDVERGQLGEIGISVYISNTEVLKGNEIKSLLDELINIYSTKYILNNKIVEPKNGFDWTLFDSLAKNYNSKLLPNLHNFNYQKSGTKDPAFHYYKSDNELIELFDNPFQEEYSDYKQIYFIDSKLQGESNPLNVLKNSGIEVNPDLSNDYLYLNYINPIEGLSIKAKFNGQWNERTGDIGKNIIRLKWPVKIYYEKDKRCYEPFVSQEKPVSELSDYFEISGNRINVKTDLYNKPVEIKKEIKFTVLDYNENEITNVQIVCKCDNLVTSKTTNINKIEFMGRELIERWIAELITNEYSGKEPFTPEINNEVVIKVEKRKRISLNVTDEYGIPLLNFEIKTNLTKTFQRSDSLDFVNEQISRPCHLIVRSKGYEDWNEQVFIPTEKENINVKLIKIKRNKPGTVKLNLFFTKLRNIILKHIAIAKFGIIIPLIVVGIWLIKSNLLISNKAHKITFNTQQIKDQIKKYVDGDSLFTETLIDYTEKWNAQQKNYIDMKGKGTFLGKRRVDSTNWKKEWNPVYESINYAISKRNLINRKSFADLKKLNYSNNQVHFRDVIEKVDSTKYEDVRQKLGDVSNLTLSDIANNILELLNSKNIGNKIETEAHVENPQYSKISQNNVLNKNKIVKTENKEKKETEYNEISSEIKEYLISNELKIEVLKTHVKNENINTRIIKSIHLCLKLWDLDGKKDNSYYSYLKELKKDKILSNSNLINFVDKMVQNKNPKYVSNLPEIDKKKSLSQIEIIINK